MTDSRVEQVEQHKPRTITSILDARRINAWQIAVVVVGLCVLLVDGLDLQLLSYVAPVVTQEWGIQPAQLGVALSGALIGMAIGTAVGGLLGDRWGRRRAAVASVLVFGAATAAAALSPGVPVLTVLRVVAGLGFGAAMPNVYVLVSEVLPVRARPRAAGLLSVGTPVGGLLGGSVALALLTAIGWRWLFVLCGVLSLLLAVLILAVVPESPSYQLAKGDQTGLGEPCGGCWGPIPTCRTPWSRRGRRRNARVARLGSCSPDCTCAPTSPPGWASSPPSSSPTR